MIDPTTKKTARRTISESVSERDIDRLMNIGPLPVSVPAAASASGTALAAGEVLTARPGEVFGRFDAEDRAPDGLSSDAVEPHALTIWDAPVFILYACLGVFTRIWTDVTLYFDFNGDSAFRAFAVAVSIALHLFIFAIIGNAWRAKWVYRTRNLLALAALFGYMGFRTLTQL